MDTGLLMEPDVSFSASILTPRSSRDSWVAGIVVTSPVGEVTWNSPDEDSYASLE